MYGLGRTKKTEVVKEAESLGYVHAHSCEFAPNEGLAIKSKWRKPFTELKTDSLRERSTYLRGKKL